MLTGCNLEELQARIVTAQAAKNDLIIPTSELRAGGNGEGVFIQAGQSWYKTGEVAQNNLATLAGIPTRWFRDQSLTHPAKAADILDYYLKANVDSLPRQRMVRTIGTKCRAVLSDKFLRLDHHLALDVALPQLLSSGAEIKSVLVTEKRMAIQAVFPRLQGEAKVGDIVQFGAMLTNSEVGLGRFGLEAILYRLRCLNGMIGLEKGGGYSRRHITARQGVTLVSLDKEDLTGVMGAEMRALLDPQTFQRQLLLTQDAAAFKIPEEFLPQAIKAIQKEGLEITEGEQVLEDWMESQDCSLWGLGNAVTLQAHNAGAERSLELERLGAKVITLPRSAWKVA